LEISNQVHCSHTSQAYKQRINYMDECTAFTLAAALSGINNPA
jgi:hypothetical protein